MRRQSSSSRCPKQATTRRRPAHKCRRPQSAATHTTRRVRAWFAPEVSFRASLARGHGSDATLDMTHQKSPTHPLTRYLRHSQVGPTAVVKPMDATVQVRLRQGSNHSEVSPTLPCMTDLGQLRTNHHSRDLSYILTSLPSHAPLLTLDPCSRELNKLI